MFNLYLWNFWCNYAFTDTQLWFNSKLDRELVNALNRVDLLVLEGMGRAVHTNLDARFTCETLKLAVIKNKWLAERLGGPVFSVLCRYERPNASS